MNYREPIGKRIGRFLLLMTTIAVIVGVVVITQRFSTETLAFVVGGLFAIAIIAVILLPICLLGYALLRARMERPQQQTQQTVPMVFQVQPQQPMLGQQNGYGPGYGTPPMMESMGRGAIREWEVLGGEAE